jgi:hypothetical protein
MTDDLVKRLRSWAPLVATGHEVPAAGQSLFDAADRIEQLESLFPAILEYLEDQSDVVDGDNGIPSPNKAMALLVWTKHALGIK